jgi:hypothetical protein
MKSDSIDLWLWRDATGSVRYVSLRETGYLPALPLLHGDENLSELHEGNVARTARDVLHADLLKILQSTHRPDAVLRLHLLSSLPDIWQTVPLECLGLNNLQVIRHAAAPHGVSVTSTEPGGTLLNLWPRHEPVQPARDLSRHPVCHLYTRNPEDNLNRGDTGSWLAVVAHGNEQAEGPPLRLADNTPWQLPREQNLPPLVLLMACGTACGNLLRYGKKLLDAGVRTVVVASGLLDAEAARDFLNRFAEAWPAGQSIGELWFRLRTEDERPHGCRRLYLLGDSGLRVVRAGMAETSGPSTGSGRTVGETSSGLTEKEAPRPDGERLRLIAAAQTELQQEKAGPALANVLATLTLGQLLDYGDLDGIQYKLWPSLDMDEAGENEQRQLLKAVTDHPAAIPPIVQWWLIPWLAYLAESLDHDRMITLMRQCEALQNQPHIPLFVYLYWSLPHYRMGCYSQAMTHVMAGLRRCYDADMHRIQGGDLLGMLANLLLDINLPGATLKVLDLLHRDLNYRTDAHARDESFRLLDRKARCALRTGQIPRARALYQKKLQLARAMGEDGLRETGWLLYLAAWGGEEDASARAAVLQALNETATDPVSLAGNSNTVYLLRALAAWAWLGQDEAAWQTVAAWKEILDRHCLDKGPPGFIWVFQYRAARNFGYALPDMSEWQMLEVGLEEQAYWLELTVLNALLGHAAHSERALNCLHGQRQDALKSLEPLPDWLQPQLGGIHRELEQRQEQERLIWLEQIATRPAAKSIENSEPVGNLPDMGGVVTLRQSGLLPL